MSLLNSQYDEIMAGYDRIREAHTRELDDRTEEIFGKYPAVRSLCEEAATLSLQTARMKIANPDTDTSSLPERLAMLNRQKARILTDAGYPADYLTMQYDCRICHDSGFVNGKKCVCFRKAEIALLYRHFELGDILKQENFEHFSFDVYSDTIINESTKKTARETAQDAYIRARAFTSEIGSTGSSLFIYGPTGVGKTFLTHCIAKEALDHSCSTLYFSAQDLFDLLADAAFARHTEEGSYRQMILKTDLLIIDDLGTELTNNLVLTELFRVINERIQKNRSTIISTNLHLTEFMERYSERIFSRITSSYTMIKLIGNDIRLMKKTQGGS